MILGESLKEDASKEGFLSSMSLSLQSCHPQIFLMLQNEKIKENKKRIHDIFKKANLNILAGIITFKYLTCDDNK